MYLSSHGRVSSARSKRQSSHHYAPARLPIPPMNAAGRNRPSGRALWVPKAMRGPRLFGPAAALPQR
jgi:hypothetical protein